MNLTSVSHVVSIQFYYFEILLKLSLFSELSGDDPLADEEDACEKINSAAGVLKMFFRELKPPLFPLPLFDELIACSGEYS